MAAVNSEASWNVGAPLLVGLNINTLNPPANLRDDAILGGHLRSAHLVNANNWWEFWDILTNLWNALTAANGVGDVWGIPPARHTDCLNLLRAFFFPNAIIGTPRQPEQYRPEPVYVKLQPDVNRPHIYVINPINVGMPGLGPGSTLPISDWGSALGYILSVSIRNPPAANRETDNFALPALVMYSMFLIKLQGAGRVDDAKVPHVTTVMWPRNTANAAAVNGLPLLMGSTLCYGTLNPGPPDLATGRHAVQQARESRANALNARRPLPRCAPVKEENVLANVRALILKCPEIRDWTHPAHNGRYILQDDTANPPGLTDTGALQIRDPRGFEDSRWSSPRARIRKGHFDAQILRFARFAIRYRDGGQQFVYPANQPGGPPLPYNGMTYQAALAQFLRDIMVVRRPKIVAAGAPNAVAVTRNNGLPPIYYAYEDIVVPPLPGSVNAAAQAGRVENALTWYNPHQQEDANRASMRHAFADSRVDDIRDGQMYGHCSETFPFLYFAQMFPELLNIPAPGAVLNDANPAADFGIVEGLSIRMANLDALLRNNNIPNNDKFNRTIAKGISNQRRLQILMDPCNNCKSLVRMHRHDDVQFANYCHTLNYIYNYRGGAMEYEHPWRSNRAYW